MKTTIEISDDLMARARRLATQQGTTLRALVERGLRLVLREQERVEPFRLRDASVKGRGLAPELEGRPWGEILDVVFPRGRP